MPALPRHGLYFRRSEDSHGCRTRFPREVRLLSLVSLRSLLTLLVSAHQYRSWLERWDIWKYRTSTRYTNSMNENRSCLDHDFPHVRRPEMPDALDGSQGIFEDLGEAETVSISSPASITGSSLVRRTARATNSMDESISSENRMEMAAHLQGPTPSSPRTPVFGPPLARSLSSSTLDTMRSLNNRVQQRMKKGASSLTDSLKSLDLSPPPPMDFDPGEPAASWGRNPRDVLDRPDEEKTFRDRATLHSDPDFDEDLENGLAIELDTLEHRSSRESRPRRL